MKIKVGDYVVNNVNGIKGKVRYIGEGQVLLKEIQLVNTIFKAEMLNYYWNFKSINLQYLFNDLEDDRNLVWC